MLNKIITVTGRLIFDAPYKADLKCFGYVFVLKYHNVLKYWNQLIIFLQSTGALICNRN